MGNGPIGTILSASLGCTRCSAIGLLIGRPFGITTGLIDLDIHNVITTGKFSR